MLRFDEYGALPAFANETNRRLDREVREKEARLAKVTTELGDHVSRTEALAQHMRNIKQQLAQTQNLNDARGREIDTEEHLKAVADRLVGRLENDVKRMEKSFQDTSDQATSTQNAIYRASEKVARVKSQLKSEERELEDWLKVQQEKEEDNLILLKYTKEDDQRVKDLSLHIEKLIGEVNKRNAQLSQEVTETQVTQMEMDRMADEFRKMHYERQDLLQKWEQAVISMRKRDQEIVKTQEQFQKVKDEGKDKQAAIAKQQAVLDEQTQIKNETEQNIQSLDRLVGKLKGDQVEANQLLISFQDELEALRTHLQRSSNEVSNKRNEVKALQDDVSNKKYQKSAEEDRLSSLHQKLKTVMQDTGSKEEKAAQLGEYLRQDEVHVKELDKKIKALKELFFKHNQELFRLRQEEKTLNAEISGAHAAVRNLKSKINKLDQDLIQQRTLVYNQEYSLQQLERKVKRALGDRTDEEKEALNRKIQELTQQHEEAVTRHTLLSTQLKKSQDDLRHGKRKLDVLNREKQNANDRIDELNLYSTSAAHQLAAKIKEKEEVMVEESVLRLEVKKLRGAMHARADEVLGLESRRVQLQLALEERTQEIEIHKSMLKAQIRAAEEERYSACQELREKTAQVDRMKTRYEIVMSQLSGGPDDDEEKSQAYYIIQSAQQRENLQRQGDELEQKIQKAEREIKAMENTLQLLNHKNDNFKNQLHANDVSPQDVEHRDYLQSQLEAACAKLQQKRENVAALENELIQTEQVIATLSETEAREQQQVAQLEAHAAALNKQIDEQQQKKKRAEQTVIKLSRELRKSRGLPLSTPTDEEQDMKAREAKEVGNFMLHKLEEVAGRTVYGHQIRDKVSALMEQLGILPPSRPETRLSGTSSLASSRGPSRLQMNVNMNGGRHSKVAHHVPRTVPDRGDSPARKPAMLALHFDENGGAPQANGLSHAPALGPAGKMQKSTNAGSPRGQGSRQGSPLPKLPISGDTLPQLPRATPSPTSRPRLSGNASPNAMNGGLSRSSSRGTVRSRNSLHG